MLPSAIQNKTVIIAPLDWGMGHVTRCIPLITQLLDQENKIVFAGTTVQIKLIEKDFPQLECELVEGYNIQLDSTKSTYWQLLIQSNKMRSIIKEESKIADGLSKKHGADLIISDNRYGFRSKQCKNIILTHQLAPPVPVMKSLLSAQIIKWVNQFDFCWIPDDEIEPLCNHLCKAQLSIPKYRIGFLSRFVKEKHEIKFDYLLILSGPEPEKSRFKKKVLTFFNASEHSLAIVDTLCNLDSTFSCFQNPSTLVLQKLIGQSDKIVSRAGYTTIMEMISIEKEAILIPTKGQFEQEYLAKNIKSPFISFLSEDELKKKLCQK